MDAKKQRALRHYEKANQNALTADAQTAEARKTIKEYNDQKDRLNKWEQIMSMEPVSIFMFIFIAVAIAEFIFSYEIYREMIPRAPYVMAIAFFGVGILLSELIVYLYSKRKRELKLYEAKRNPLNADKIDSDLKKSIKKDAVIYFILGIVGAIALLIVIYKFSISRALLEISSGERTSKVGIQDWLPLILYAFEIFLGIYFFYFFKKIAIQLKVSKLNRKLEKLINSIKENTAEAINNYQQAEKENYDPFALAISDDLNTAYYRKINKSIEDKEEYVNIEPKTEDYFNVKLVDTKGNPLSKHISIITKYKFTDTGYSDKEGNCKIILETYPNDSVQYIFIRNAANSAEYKTIIANYDLNKNEIYTLIIDENEKQ